MFRNVRFYSLEGDWPASEEALSKDLERAGFEPCGPFTERSSGWVAVDADTSDLLARRVNGADLLRLRSQSRVLPHSVIREELEARIEEYRERTQEAPSPREKRRLKAEARDELMPKSMLKSDRVWGYFDIKEKILGIDAAQESAAERFLRRLQASCDRVNFKPLQYRKPFDDLLTKVFLGGAPGQFTVGRECRMQDAADTGSLVRWTNFDLSDSSVRDHVAHGMRLTHLEIVFENVMRFVLSDKGVVTKLRFLGMDDDSEDLADPLARLDAEFVLLTGTLRKLLGDLKKVLGGLA
ncbi:MAG: recombination-associated protein RdgC [Gammaproteobacteria bacterium]|nr:recombination-associated protein RdgC [Gammaproteobacteria bacterium]